VLSAVQRDRVYSAIELAIAAAAESVSFQALAHPQGTTRAFRVTVAGLASLRLGGATSLIVAAATGRSELSILGLLLRHWVWAGVANRTQQKPTP
jgi:hypothetical protein